MTLNEFRVSIWSNENVLKLDCGDDCTTPQMFPRTHWTTFTLKRWPLRYTDYIPTQLFLKTVFLLFQGQGNILMEEKKWERTFKNNTMGLKVMAENLEGTA